MNSEPDIDRVEQLMADERAGRPRWFRFAEKRAPAWFAGEELDLLDAAQLNDLYRAKRAHISPWGTIPLTLIVLPRMVEGLLSRETRLVWLGAAVFFVAALVGAWLLRRRDIVVNARRSLRERPDWPMFRAARLSA